MKCESLPAVGTALFLPAVGTALFSPAVGTALFSPAVGAALFSPAVDHPSRCSCPSIIHHVVLVLRSSITFFLSFGHPSRQLLSVLLRAVHHALRDVLVHCTLLHVLRVVCWTDQHHCSLPPRAAREGLTFEFSRSGFASTFREFCFGLWGPLPPKLFELRSSPRWPCASWSVGTSRHRHARFDDQSACLVEPDTCDQRIKCARASRSAHGFPS